jgi:hypothetical protein
MFGVAALNAKSCDHRSLNQKPGSARLYNRIMTRAGDDAERSNEEERRA